MGMMKKASAKKQPDKVEAEAAAPQENEDQGQPDPGAQPTSPQPDSDETDQQETPEGGGEQAEPDSDSGEQGGAPDSEGEPDDSSAQDTGQPGSPADDTGGGPAAGEDMRSIPAKPQQQAEYNKANQMLYQQLYQNQGVGSALLKGLQPTHKIESVVRLATLLVDQIDKKINMDQAIILPFTKDVVAHVMDVAEQVKGLQFSDDEANAALGATLQAVLHIFGVTKQQAQAFMNHMSPQDQQTALNDYHTSLSKAQAAVKGTPQAAQQGQQPQQGQPQPQQGQQPQAAQPAAGGDASQGDDSAAQQPQQGGGMMSQAEQAQPAGGQEEESQ